MGVGAATGLGSNAVSRHAEGPIEGKINHAIAKHGRKLQRLPCKKALGCHPVEKHLAQAGEIVGAAEAVGGAAATAYGAYNHDQSVQDAGEAAMGVGAATGLGSNAVSRQAAGPIEGKINHAIAKHGRKLQKSNNHGIPTAHPVAHHVAQAGESGGAAEAGGGAAATA